MLYREAGDFKTTYSADQQTFPIKSERVLFWIFVAVAFLVVPFFINDYWNKSVLMPLLIYSMAAIGLNILVGYCGQVSLGTGGFMAVGAFACYKLMTAFPWMDMFTITILSGFVPRGSNPGSAILPGLDVQQVSMVLQLLLLRSDHRARADTLRDRHHGPGYFALGNLSVRP